MEAYQPGNPNLSEISNHDWTDEDFQKIMKYLEEATTIEAMMKVVLQKLLEKTGVTSKWNFIKAKVKNFKLNFKRSNEWGNSTEARYLDTKRVEVMQMNHLDQQRNEICDELMPSRTNCNGSDAGDSIFFNEPQRIHSAKKVLTLQPTDFEVSYSSRVAVLDIKSNAMNNTPLTSAESTHSSKGRITKKVKNFVKNIKNINCMQSSGSYLSAIRLHRLKQSEMWRTKLEWQRKKHEKELEMSEKKLDLEVEWTRAHIDLKRRELQLKEKAIEIDEKLRLLDMEKDERLRKYEMEFKYKCEC